MTANHCHRRKGQCFLGAQNHPVWTDAGAARASSARLPRGGGWRHASARYSRPLGVTSGSCRTGRGTGRPGPCLFLDYLIAEPLTVHLLYRAGALIQIPRPTRLPIHKLIVSERCRGSDAIQRAQKDRSLVAFMIRVLAEEDPHALPRRTLALWQKSRPGSVQSRLRNCVCARRRNSFSLIARQ